MIRNGSPESTRVMGVAPRPRGLQHGHHRIVAHHDAVLLVQNHAVEVGARGKLSAERTWYRQPQPEHRPAQAAFSKLRFAVSDLLRP
jgi:hypothetical protein